ncbi:MAG: methyltransferase [Hyphomonadaceae bacterium]
MKLPQPGPAPFGVDPLRRALDHVNAGRFDLAAPLAERLLDERPHDGDALNLAGIVSLQAGRAAEAAQRLAAAQTAQPRNPFIAFNLGRALLQAGAPAKALRPFKTAASLKADFAEAHAGAGDALLALGRMREAQSAFAQALTLRPGFFPALHGLGLLALRQGDHAAAALGFEKALAHAPAGDGAARAAALGNLGLARLQAGAGPQAIGPLLEACEAAPQAAAYRSALVAALTHVKAAPDDPRLRPALEALLARPDVNPRALASVTQAHLAAAHDLMPVFAALARDGEETDLAPYAARLEALCADPLFLALIANAPVTSVGFELLLTRLRRRLLEAASHGGPASLAFACALAQQCFLNEYVFFLAQAEEAQFAALASIEAPAVLQRAVYACYRSLAAAPWPPLAEPPSPFASVLRQQIEEPARERKIAEALPTLSSVEDAVSQAVRAQYEENPYPRWSRVTIGAPMSLGALLCAELPHAQPREAPQTQAPRVLIAGCGTGLQTMHAVTRLSGASVLAVDLSRASLAYGARKIAEYGVPGVTHMQADILALGQLSERFDLIESFGVIHHMADPARALAILAGLAKPGGLVYLGLYSAIARQSVVAARDFIAARHDPANAEGVRRARRAIMLEGDPALAPLLSPASDFWTTSDCRDLIFHVQEHRFTLLEIEAMLRGCGLEFLGLSLPTPGDRALFAAENPDPRAARALPAWHAFELRHPELFGDTYRIWAKKR